MLSQLLAGGRSTVLVALVAGLVATVLSVVIGVTAGYAAGLADDLLSMLANFFLVMPALPLLIVIFGFLPPSQGSDDVLIGLIIAITGWAFGAPGCSGPRRCRCATGTTWSPRGSSASAAGGSSASRSCPT